MRSTGESKSPCEPQLRAGAGEQEAAEAVACQAGSADPRSAS